MVSLQACLTIFTLSAPLFWGEPPRPRQERTAPTPLRISYSECACPERCCTPSSAPAWLSEIGLSAFVQGPDTYPGRVESHAALSAIPANCAPGLSDIGVAIARQPLGPSVGWLWKWLNPTRRSIRRAGSSVWTAMERVAMATNLVTFCCSTERLGRNDRLSFERAVLVGILSASSLFGTTQSHCCSSSRCTSARNLVDDACAWKCNGDAQPSVWWPAGAAKPHG